MKSKRKKRKRTIHKGWKQGRGESWRDYTKRRTEDKKRSDADEERKKKKDEYMDNWD